VADDDRGGVGVGQAVAAGQRQPVAPGVLDRGGRVGLGAMRGELEAEVRGLGVLVGRGIGVPGVGDDVRGRPEVFEGGVFAVPAQHQRVGGRGEVGADQEEGVVLGQGGVVVVQVLQGLRPFGGRAER
jgi:hypothetical protein